MTTLPDPTLPWPIAMPAVALIAERETLRLRAYRCQAGVPTIGWGRTDGVRMGDTCTKEEADRWLCDDLATRSKAVQSMCTEYANENQLGALVSLAYNIGLRDDKKRSGLYYSTILRRHNAGDFDGAARAFDLYNEYTDATTKQRMVSRGLTARRKAEAALYLTPDTDAPPEHMPQAVAAETPIAASPIAQSGAVTAGAGVLGVLSQAGDL